MHHCEAFGADRVYNQFTRVKPIKSAVFFGDDVDRSDHGLVECRVTVGDCLCCGCFFNVRAAIGAHRTFGVHERVHWQACPLGNFVVVEIVRACDFHGAGPEGHIRVGVGDDWDQAALRLWSHRDFAQRPNDRSIAFIVFVHGHGTVPQHGFGARCGYSDVVAFLR